MVIKKETASNNAKILVFDIETAPNLSYVWAQYEQNVLAHVEESYMLSFSYKWLGDKTTHVKALSDYKTYKPGDTNDKHLVKDLWDLLDEADIVIGHNADAFDILKANTRFIFHKMDPPKFYRTIDTLKIARKVFKFNSNKLDDLGNFLGVGRKVKHTGFSLWLGCMAGERTSWNLMKKYNIQDVDLLERVYLELRKWMPKHPNVSIYSGNSFGCRSCGSHNLIKRGFAYTDVSTAQRYQCKDCKSYSTGSWVKVKAVAAAA